MIVKNESRIIRRCLESARPVCDVMCICDTGSTDNTRELIEAYFAEHADSGLEGYLYQHEWRDFGHNRTLSLEMARDKATYMLCIDADMVLEVDEGVFDKGALNKPSYKIAQRTNRLFYYNVRLLRSDLAWKSIGVTHEYYTAPGDEYGRHGVTGLVICDFGDGGAKADKYERDIRLLTQGLIDEPDNARYMFYMAQSHKDLGHWETAIEWYRKRILCDEYQEERWYARYMVGRCLRKFGRWPEALHAYLEAYNSRPHRAEPIYEVAKYYRKLGNHERLALDFACLGLSIAFPHRDQLFVQHDVYAWKFLWEVAIVAYCANQPDLGLYACERLIHNVVPHRTECPRGMPEPAYQDHCMSNRIFYLRPLSHYAKVQMKRVYVPLETNWHACNPSIWRNAQSGQWTMLVRCVNYELHPETSTYTYPFDVVETKTVVLSPTASEMFASATAATAENAQDIRREGDLPVLTLTAEADASMVRYPSYVLGFEDVRLVQLPSGQWLGTATCKETHKEGYCEIVLLHLSGAPQWDITRVLPMCDYDNTRHQKNWMPFVHQGHLHILYMCDPLVVLRPNIETGACEVVVQRKRGDQQWRMTQYRGGSQGLAFNGGYLFVIHEVALNGDRRLYSHRFIYLHTPTGIKDATYDEWHIEAISPPFYLTAKTTEFVSGLAYENGRFILSMGLEDNEALIVAVPELAVRGMLRYGDNLKQLFDKKASAMKTFK